MALYADGPTTLRNIASWRVKETDRIAAMATELRKLGATVEEGADYIRITPGRQAAGKRPASTPMTTTASPCASRWRPSTLPAAGAHRRPQMRGQDLPRLFRGAVLRGEAEREQFP
jgi:3-phosphoshikimate 1-carboxyvinyltransferase